MSKHLHTKRDEVEVFWVPADMDVPCGLKVITNNYAGLQRFVGGYVRPYPFSLLALPEVRCGCDLAMLVDEDGIMKRLPINARATICGSPSQPILGDAVIIAQGPISKGDFDFWGLPEYMNRWEGPGFPVPVDKSAEV